jgi:hypothetical protein
MNTGMIHIKNLTLGIFSLLFICEVEAKESTRTALEKANLKKSFILYGNTRKSSRS